MKTLGCTLLLTLTFAPGSAPAVERADVTEIFSPLIGAWRTAKRRQTVDGQHFHYLYSLEWFDVGQAMVRMTILREFEEGIQGLRPGRQGTLLPRLRDVFRYGFSPSGRLSRGEVRIAEDGSLVTSYTGYGPGGTPVEIRNVSSPVAEDRFTTVTTLRRTADDPWREIGRDTWVRVSANQR